MTDSPKATLGPSVATVPVTQNKVPTSHSDTEYDDVKGVGSMGDGDEIIEIDRDAEKRVLRKLDLHIVPMAVILYLVCFLDRANIGNAAIGGMTTELKFPTNGLSLAVSIFYVTYVIFETPATMLLRTLKPSRLIPAIVLIWGGISIGNGFAHSYGAVIACRLILGMCEAAFSPCIILYMTTFYRREELGLRICYLYMTIATSGVIGGLLATGLLKMNGIRGLSGWRWLYIIEGALTMLVGVVFFFLIADTYENASYLTEEDKAICRLRDKQEAVFSKDEGFSWVEVRKALTDPVIYLSGVAHLGFDTCMYAFATFLVVIVRGFGYDPIASQGLTAPVYAWCAMCYLGGTLLTMKYHSRYWVMMGTGVVTIAGYGMLIANVKGQGPRLVACFLTGTGIYLCVGLHVTWLAQNIAGFRKRSVSVGMQQTMGNIGGVIAGQIYRDVDKPAYILGHATSLGLWAMALIGITVEWYVWRTRNRRRDEMTVEEKESIDAKGVTGDHHYNFRYTL